jgi:hypothetical protein
MTATRVLRWSLSLVLGIPAIALALSARPAPLIAIGVTEAIGAVLLQPPRTRRLGAGLLLLALVAAAVLHALSGDRPPPAFLVYAAAIAVVASPC